MPLAYRTEAAERDLQDIAFQIAIADGHPATSDRLIDELIAQCNRLAEFAGTSMMGTAAPELGDGVRQVLELNVEAAKVRIQFGRLGEEYVAEGEGIAVGVASGPYSGPQGRSRHQDEEAMDH